MAGRAESFTGRHGDVFAFEKLLRDRGGVRHCAGFEMRGNVWEHVKRAERRRAALLLESRAGL